MNILYLLTDQLRFDALSCNGAPICKTPEIDKLARNGVNFDCAYTIRTLKLEPIKSIKTKNKEEPKCYEY